MILTFLYCEGPHDMAFLAKLIKEAKQAKSEINKVADLPETIKKLVSSAIDKVENESIRIDKPLQVFFPNKVFALKGEHYICLYSMGGKDRLNASLQNIKDSKLLISHKKITKVDSVRHAFVLDADYRFLENGQENEKGGIENTLKNLSTEIKKVIDDFPSFEKHASWLETDYGDIGNFIFTDSTNTEGTLEDLLETLIKDNTKPMIAHSEDFCDQVKAFDALRKAKTKDKTKIQKIKFTSITQVYHPGSSLAVGLQNDKIIDSEKIKKDKIVTEFESFIDFRLEKPAR
ncbi:DUF3226 domain-containing protein [Pseudoalteromonas viridis]|uniref:DUF4276 family protein n=1 Tax=Pseudoalteromonas viridis TaxID=339617 RepID=A0ABX7V8H7_9GAMM|nr:DUF3226 domain-containing protein [Pseudoalteromonas viridis]QTL35967.1 hypothetical protein J5X90_02620 [Pseudoalteromonas viridis]